MELLTSQSLYYSNSSTAKRSKGSNRSINMESLTTPLTQKNTHDTTTLLASFISSGLTDALFVSKLRASYTTSHTLSFLMSATMCFKQPTKNSTIKTVSTKNF